MAGYLIAFIRSTMENCLIFISTLVSWTRASPVMGSHGPHFMSEQAENDWVESMKTNKIMNHQILQHLFDLVLFPINRPTLQRMCSIIA